MAAKEDQTLILVFIRIECAMLIAVLFFSSYTIICFPFFGSYRETLRFEFRENIEVLHGRRRYV